MSTLPRHTTLDSWQSASENARDTILSLQARPEIGLVQVDRYTAVGSSDALIRIGARARPWAVMLARVCLVDEEATPLVVVDVRNFVWDATTGSLDVFEPYGLAADSVYKLQFITIGVTS